jgi:malate synthase
VVETAVVVQDDYVYYPDYEVYYSSSRHEYAYREGSAWVSRPAPRGVTVNVLLASPSVRMDFHDSPANHHAEVVRQYPKNWKPSAPKQAPKENQKDGQRDDRGENNGR